MGIEKIELSRDLAPGEYDAVIKIYAYGLRDLASIGVMGVEFVIYVE